MNISFKNEAKFKYAGNASQYLPEINERYILLLWIYVGGFTHERFDNCYKNKVLNCYLFHYSRG